MTTLICVSASEAQTAELLKDGPRRDFAELARATGGTILYARAARAKGLMGRIAGPHVRQAWNAARRLRTGDTAFADGEHIGLPLLGFLAFTLRRRVRVVMLGHLIDRPWKLGLFRVLTRLVPAGTVVVHSELQRSRLSGVLAGSWTVRLVPYQVDTEYWQTSAPLSGDGPILAVGSENRDYATLLKAVASINRPVKIAAGSHWARKESQAEALPANVEFVSRPLRFPELRDAYSAASVVVFPLLDVANQSGVTGILEAMSMGRPVVVTANAGQRECVTGPLVRGDGTNDSGATADRGPQLFGGAAAAGITGLYAACGDAASLETAIRKALDDDQFKRSVGANSRVTAQEHFSIERFVATLAEILAPAPRVASREVVAAL